MTFTFIIANQISYMSLSVIIHQYTKSETKTFSSLEDMGQMIIFENMSPLKKYFKNCLHNMTATNGKQGSGTKGSAVQKIYVVNIY